MAVSSSHPPEPRPAPYQRFQLCCRDVHHAGCDEMFSAANAAELVELICKHGAFAHGFTPVWYTDERVGAIAGAVTRFV